MRKIILIATALLSTTTIFAQGNKVSADNTNILIILTLIIALATLILASINAYNIARNKKVRDVNLYNQKDDINVTMDVLKDELQRDIRALRRELSKIERNSKQKTVQPIKKKTIQANTEVKDKDEEGEKKAVKKRQYKRRPYKKKPTEKIETINTESAKGNVD
jgi:hypothetical protein